MFLGNESAEFWYALGGKGEYTSTKLLEEINEAMPARLFQCSTASGNFKGK